MSREKSKSKFHSIKPQIKIQTEAINKDYISIRISDNRTGIPEEVKKRIFEPFYTTKPVGKGTGLGLSLSYQIIVEKHGGNFDCNSIVGEGTEFVIQLSVAFNTSR